MIDIFSNETTMKNKIKKTLGRKIFSVANYTLLTFITVVSLLPILNVLSMSLSSSAAVASGLIKLWPVDFTVEAYKRVFENEQFYKALLISIERCLLGVSINMLCVILIAYPLSKERAAFRCRKIYVWYFIFTMLFSGGLIPIYFVVKSTGIYDTIWALVLPAAVPVFNVLLLMNFFRQIPKEIEESATIDGAGHLTILLKIFLPLSKAALATLILFSFVFHWNSWFDGMIYRRNSDGYPLQTYLYTMLTVPELSKMTAEEMKSYFSVNQRSMKAAQIFVSTIPIFLFYPLLQKYFTTGIVLGAVKG